MRNIGIVAEYNPFHNGHKYQIDYAKKVLGFDNVIIAMSGSFTQRGEIAVFDKYTRAQCALLSGADLILEIPTIFATASAREFASAAVTLLASTGIISDILFGTEDASEDDILAISKAIISAETSSEFDNIIKKELSNGSSYAVARAKAIMNYINTLDICCSSQYEKLLSTPNNILAIEYTCCILRNGYDINIHCLNRSDNGYHSMIPHGEFASASYLRSVITGDSSQFINYIPNGLHGIITSTPILTPNSVSLLLHEKLITHENFTDYLDCSAELSNKIKNNIYKFTSYTDFINILKSKELSYTRISRVLCHILLGINNDIFTHAKEINYISYIRVLGCTESGSKLLSYLSNKSIPLITSINQDVNLFLDARNVYNIDIYAYNITQIINTNINGLPFENEGSRRFLRI